MCLLWVGSVSHNMYSLMQEGLASLLCPVSAVTLVHLVLSPLSLPGFDASTSSSSWSWWGSIQRWLVEITQFKYMFTNIQQVQNHIKPSPHVEQSTEISCANPMVSPWAWWNHSTSALVTYEESVLVTSRKQLLNDQTMRVWKTCTQLYPSSPRRIIPYLYMVCGYFDLLRWATQRVALLSSYGWLTLMYN
mgnify:CR=1 FL=1